ncbi:MAG: excinuclease ABC subunit A, partial [Chitinophagales bacterium]|nr:excinuclease ABC subunit A [Chitinophagales bacterium]
MSEANAAISLENFADIDPAENIIIKGARLHNLKNVDVVIPKNQFTVVTGVSGSGKSSLCIDTLFAEGQRRYVESLSSYARQFLSRMQKPDVDYIKGICPAIAIEQKVSTRTSRSTVGTLTEIYDYLRLLYARIGITFSPVSGKRVKKHEVSDVIDHIEKQKEGSKVFIYFPQNTNGNLEETLKNASIRGFVRVRIDGKISKINDLLESELPEEIDKVFILVDRIVYKSGDEDLLTRIADSVQISFYEGYGDCFIKIEDQKEIKFSNSFEMDGIIFNEPTPHFFNFNNPYGACKTCEGFGSTIGIDEELVIPNKTLSVYDGAIAPWRGEKMKRWQKNFLKVAADFDFPIHRDFQYLTKDEKDLLWKGNSKFKGLNAFFKYLEEKSYKIQYRV